MITADARRLMLALAGRTALAGCTALAAAPMAALAGGPGGFPQGTWLLDETASRPLAATSQALEIINDDGQSLSFNLKKTGENGATEVMSWHGTYGGAPHLIEGSSILFAVAHGPGGSILISGQLADTGKLKEKCHIAPDRQRFRCDGTFWGSDGKKRTYVEIYHLQR